MTAAPPGAASELENLADGRRLAGLMAQLPGMVYRCCNDRDWTLQFVGGRVEELTGYTREQLLADPPMVKPNDAVHPDDRERVWRDIQHAVARQEPYTLEYRLRTQAGAEKWVWERGYAVLTAAGDVEALEGFVQDITERKRAELGAREADRVRRLVIDTGPECVKVVAPDGRLLQMNPAGLAMLEAATLEEAQRCALTDYITPAHRGAFTDLHRRVLAGEDASLEFEVVGLRGTHRWLETHAVPLRDERDGLVGLLGITRDVTERRQQQQRIARLNRMRGVMSSINALIVRTRSRTELFQDACRIAVEEGGFGLAWIGVTRPDRELLLVARHPMDGGLLDGLDAALASGARLPTLRALREGRAQVCNDIARDEALAPWREQLRELGYGSLVALPLNHQDKVVGTLNLYAREAGAFDDEELRLLAELSRDVAYALEFIIKDEALDFLSIYDSLTQLPNRALFMQRLPALVEAARDSSRRLAVLMLDIERFKAINDAIGQAGGDALLKQVSERLKFHAGGQGYIARIAGDRFAVVVAGLDRAVDPEALVHGTGWDRLDPPFHHGAAEFPVTFKIGLAVFPQDAADPEALLRNAELALKHGKANGRVLTRYAAAMGEVAARKLRLGQQLRRALERRELVLHYQPKLELREGRVCGAEALLRWRGADGVLVPPDDIVPLMEETGLIVDVGQWALRQAQSDRDAWLAAGLPALPVAVNVSAAQIREPGFVAMVRDTLGTGVPGIELEVTESMMMADPDTNVAKMRELREAGVRLALDDFGTGYSSLGHLARLPLDTVKIDRSFIARMADDHHTAMIVGAIISLAHSMNLRVVAEGVETAAQLQALRLLRCDEIQGFLFSAALPAAQFAELLRSGRVLARAPPPGQKR